MRPNLCESEVAAFTQRSRQKQYLKLYCEKIKAEQASIFSQSKQLIESMYKSQQAQKSRRVLQQKYGNKVQAVLLKLQRLLSLYKEEEETIMQYRLAIAILEDEAEKMRNKIEARARTADRQHKSQVKKDKFAAGLTVGQKDRDLLDSSQLSKSVSDIGERVTQRRAPSDEKCHQARDTLSKRNKKIGQISQLASQKQQDLAGIC